MSTWWSLDATDDQVGAHIGPHLFTNVHPVERCAGRPCVLHNPSEHHMRPWPTLWRADTRLMERTCPHGIGHPDPDDMAHHQSRGQDWKGVHSCDGCCSPPPADVDDRCPLCNGSMTTTADIDCPACDGRGWI